MSLISRVFYLLLSLCECNEPMRCDKRYCNISTWTSNTFKSWFTRCYHSFFISMLSQTACALSLHSALNIIGIFVAFICGAESTSHTHNITSHKRIAEMRKKYGQLMVKWHTKSRHIVAIFLQFLICIPCLQSFFLMVMNAFFRLCMNIFVNIIGIVNVVFIESSSFASKSMDSYRLFIFSVKKKKSKENCRKHNRRLMLIKPLDCVKTRKKSKYEWKEFFSSFFEVFHCSEFLRNYANKRIFV